MAWIVVHDQNGKTALFDPDTRTSVRDTDNARVMSDESLRVDIITVTESLADLAQLLGAVELGECPECKGTGTVQEPCPHYGTPTLQDNNCPHCHGSYRKQGFVSCLTCSGTGKTVQPYSERGE